MHIFLIPDGNRRYNYTTGHLTGVLKVKDFINWCKQKESIKELSIYTLSSDNIKNRNKEEIDRLTSVLEQEIQLISSDVNHSLLEGLNVHFITTSNNLPASLKETISRAEVDLLRHNKLPENNKLKINLLIGYDSLEEVVNMVNKVEQNKDFSANIPFHELLHKVTSVGYVDLVIRTGGTKRLSNGLLLQCGYAELYFTDTLFPDFTEEEFENSLKWYSDTFKNFGH